MLEAGTQRAILSDIGFVRSNKKGTLGLEFTFNCLNDENEAFQQTKCYRWLVGPSDTGKGTIEFVMKDLVICGLKDGVKKIKVLGEEDAINKYFDQQVVDLQLDYDEYEGRRNLRVQFINKEGSSAFNKLSVNEATKDLGGMDIDKMLAKVRSEAGSGVKKSSSKKKKEEDEEIPF